MRLCAVCRLRCDYGQYGRLQSLIPACGGTVTDTRFDDGVTVCFIMTREALDSFTPRLADASNGSVTVTVEGENYFRVS